MMNLLPEKYRILNTLDGSPTLEFSGDHGTENMHNFHGAFSETDYIYGEALRVAISKGFPLSVLSIGLGIGYNEIMTAAYALKHGVDARLDSFEIDEFLRHEFWAWLQDGKESPLSEVYLKISQLFSEKLDLDTVEVVHQLRQLSQNHSFKFKEEFSIKSSGQCDYTVMFYDPFSSKTNPSFWSQEAIEEVLDSLAGPKCVFTTYAATGSLKRALISCGFELTVRDGFGGKRQSFLATRG